MKIVVLDGHTKNPRDLNQKGLESLGELTVYDRTPEEQVVERIGRAEAVYIDKTPISAQTIRSYPSLRLIGALATGYNIVDIHAAGETGVAVLSIPSYGTDAVAQYAIALLLELYRHAGFYVDCVKAGEWTRCEDWRFWKHPLTELAGETMGIIGFGRIRRRTAVIAETLDMGASVYDRYQNEDLETDNCRYVDLEELLACSDVISFHCPLLPETEKVINRQTAVEVKGGVLIVSTSRRKLVERTDPRKGFDSGRIGGAAMDVVSIKPIQGDSPLLGAKNMLITLHIAWAPRESRQRLMDIAVENLVQFMAGTPQHVVSKP